MAAPFIVDSNFFIQAHRMHYPMDVFPNFWVKVKQLADDGIIASIDKVRDELYAGKDDLSIWCKGNLPPTFFNLTASVISEYAQVVGWASAMTHHYTTGALAEFLHTDEADAWLVAFCFANRVNLVTHEVSDPLAKKRIKIPDACVPFGVPCLNTIDMFRALGETF